MVFVKMDVFDVGQRSKKVQKGPAAPTPILLANNKTGRGRAETKNAGVKKLSSLRLTLIVKQSDKGKGVGWVNSEGGG